MDATRVDALAHSAQRTRLPFHCAQKSYLWCVGVTFLALIGCSGMPVSAPPQSSVSTHTVSEQDRINALIDDPDGLAKALAVSLKANTKDPAATPLLVLAIKRQRAASFKLLLDAHADPNMPDSAGNAAWYYAMIDPSSNYLDALMAAGDSPPPAFTPGQLSAIGVRLISRAQNDRLMLLIGMPSFLADRALHTTLLRAALDRKDLIAAKALLSLPFDGSSLSFDELKPMTAPGQESLLESVLSQGASANTKAKDGQTLLYAAVNARSLSAVAILIQHGASTIDYSDAYNTPQLSLFKGLSGVAMSIVKAGANPDRAAPAFTAVDVAQMVLDKGFLQYLSKTPPSPDLATTQMYRTALAVYAKKPVEIDNSPWDAGLTASARAFQIKTGLAPHGHPSRAMSKALEPFLRDALFMAVRADNPSLISQLITVQPSLLSIRDDAGMDALMEASMSAFPDVVRVLLAAHASVKSVDPHGDTALILAALPRKSIKIAAQTLIIKDLVAAGADLNAVNADKLSAKSLIQSTYTFASAVGVNYVEPPSRIYVAVMARGTLTSSKQSWICNKAFPSDWLKKQWDEGTRLISASMVEDQWCLVTGTNVLGGSAQGYDFIQGRRALSATAQSDQRKDQTLTNFVFNDTESLAVFTNASGVRDGYRFVRLDEISSLLNDTIWKQGFAVSRIEPCGNDQWLVIFGQSMGYGGQTVVRGSFEHVVAGIRAAWKKGEAVTSLAHAGTVWVAVLSDGANEKDQTLVTSESLDDLKSAIKDKWDKDWHLALIAGGAFSDASLN
jgi:uncharacterized protein